MRFPLPRFIPSLLVCLVTTLGGPPVFGASSPELPLSELVRLAPTIVHGAVLESHSYWNVDHTLIVTETRIHVLEALRGNVPDEIVIVQPGGKVGKLRVDVDGAATFRPGEETVLFLAPGGNGELSPVGMSRGGFPVETDPHSGMKHIKITTGNAGAVRAQPLESFLEDTRAMVRSLPQVKEK